MFMRYFTTKIPRPKTVYTNDYGVRQNVAKWAGVFIVLQDSGK